MSAPRSFAFALAPFVSAVLAVGGGAAPDGDQVGLPLTLSRTTVPWGGEVRVSGASTELPTGSTVTAWLAADDGSASRLASGVVGPNGRWSVMVRPGRSGYVRANAGESHGTAGGPSRRVRVVPSVSLILPARTRPGSSVKVTGTVRPAANQGIVLYTGVAGALKRVGRATARRGGFAATVRVPPGVNRLYAAIGKGGGSEGGVVAAGVLVGLRPAGASWYGLYGEGLACGGTLSRARIGVAHKTMKCGTKVTIHYRGRTIVAPVIDRGPFVAGREFDLTGAAARALRFDGVDTIWVAP